MPANKKKAGDIRVWLDDLRPAPAGWVHVHWPDEAIRLLKTGRVAEISLDHDLGDDRRGTGYDVVTWIEEQVFLHGFKSPVIRVHSANSSARQKMLAGIRQINNLYEKQRNKRAGVFEAPPKLMSAFMDWATSVYAGHVLYWAEEKRKSLVDAEKPYLEAIATLEREIRSVPQDMRNLSEGETAQWIAYRRKADTVTTYKVGVRHDGVNFRGDPMFLTTLSEKRLTFRRRSYAKPYANAVNWVQAILTDSLDRMRWGLRRIRNSDKDKDTGPGLVETTLLIREARKYTNKAKSYKSKTKVKIPVTPEMIRDWKYWDVIVRGIGKRRKRLEERMLSLADRASGNTVWTTYYEPLFRYFGLDPKKQWSPDQVRDAVKKKPFNDREMLYLLKRVLEEGGWTKFKGVLVFQGHVTRAGVWSYSDKELEVDVPFMLPDTVEEFHDALDNIQETARHEFQHVGQSLLKDITGSLEELGLPSPSIRDMQVNPQGLLRGGPRNFRVDHALQDVEFYTRVADEIQQFVRIVRKLPKNKWRQAMRIWVAAETGRLSEVPTGRVYPHDFFVTLKSRQPGKWRKAVAEFIKGVGEAGVSIPSAGKFARQVVASDPLLPVMDAMFNVREICKQLALLEDHLQQERKRCLDCVRKHILTAEGLAEEAISLDPMREHYEVLRCLPDKMRQVWTMVQDGEYLDAAVMCREIRKPLTLMCASVRVASRHLYGGHEIKAGISDWLPWIVLPFKVLRRNYSKFVHGPIDDAVDGIIKELAPEVTRAVIEQEVDEDVSEFLEGARHGRFDALAGNLEDSRPRGSSDYQAGYHWGYAVADRWDGKDLPHHVKRDVVKNNLDEFRKQITEQVAIAAMEKAWSTVNPKEIFETVVRAVKKYGWKLGLVYGIGEIIENFVIPAAISTLTGVPVPPGSLAWLPLNDIVFSVIVRRLGNTKDVDRFNEDGYLDWYEHRYGPVRIASLVW